MTLEEYLETSEENWFLTGKKEYTVHAMMVSKKSSFHNELEDVDYTVADDGTTVILKGTAGEMWTSQLSKVMEGYTKPDGSRLSREPTVRESTCVSPINSTERHVSGKAAQSPKYSSR